MPSNGWRSKNSFQRCASPGAPEKTSLPPSQLGPPMVWTVMRSTNSRRGPEVVPAAGHGLARTTAAAISRCLKKMDLGSSGLAAALAGGCCSLGGGTPKRCNCVDRPPAYGRRPPGHRGPLRGRWRCAKLAEREPDGRLSGACHGLSRPVTGLALPSLASCARDRRLGILLDGAPARHGGGPDPGHALTDDFAVSGPGLRSRHGEEADDEAEQDGGEHDIDEAHGTFPISLRLPRTGRADRTRQLSLAH